MLDYLVSVKYRTKSICAETSVTVRGKDAGEALEAASAKVKARGGVIRVDCCTVYHALSEGQMSDASMAG